MKKFVVLTAILFLFCIKLAIAAPSVQLDPASCVKAGDSYDVIGEKLVGKNWVHYQNFMKICRVDALSGKLALFVYTLDMNDPSVVPYKNGKPFDIVNDVGPPDEFPLPGLIDTRDKLIGVLPVQIYASMPQSVQISFLDWRGNFPFRIAFHIVDPTESAPFSPYCPPALIWHPSSQSYVEAKGNFFGTCPSRP
jgi:hypothetical protein